MKRIEGESGAQMEQVEGAVDQTRCSHRALQICKEQNVFACGVMYVCGRCSKKFTVEPIAELKPEPKEPMFPKDRIPWGLRGRQA